MTSTQRLVRELRNHGVSLWIIDNARELVYDDIHTELATPKHQLVEDLLRDNFTMRSAIVQMVLNGAFDSTREEWRSVLRS